MFRRRRPTHEIPFSFDSFLDVVANVVGIIIRLILVVWVAARSYSSIIQFAPKGWAATDMRRTALPKDPLEGELSRRRAELADSQARLLELLRRLDESKEAEGRLQQASVLLIDRRRELQGNSTSRAGGDALSSEELRRRQEQLREQISMLERQPPPGHRLKYKTPVSRPVDAEEFFFECKRGRVTHIDVPRLVAQVRADMEEKGNLLRTQSEVVGVVGPAGAFRLRYTMARDADLLDAVAPGGPIGRGSYRYRVNDCVLEPWLEQRGEIQEAALAAGSSFRRIVDRIDPTQGVVTFWVYADSFGIFRALRDFLYERDLVVAGRPLPENTPIVFSPRGSQSRGQ
jgi:hypothetical protein